MPNVLVFLPSIPEIKRVLEKKNEDKDFAEIQQKIEFVFQEFHGALTPQEKNEVLEPRTLFDKTTRIILSTNIAETAVTIDNIMYVLDSGMEREYYQDPITSLNQTKEEKISKSSAIQRQGRAGRLCNGYCYKMYSEEDYNAFENQKKPEIQRMDMSDVILLSHELNDYFKISDILFYESVKDRVNGIEGLLDSKGCYKIQGDIKKLSSKGKFMIESNLETSTAAFLYENLRLENGYLGIVASVILEKPSGYFRFKERENNPFQVFTKENVRDDLIGRLGDLAPIFKLLEKHRECASNDAKSIFLARLKIDERDMRRLIKDINLLDNEVTRLSKYIESDPQSKDLAKRLSPEEMLQVAFLKTFPKNICLNVKTKYPYYLMISNKELVKVHGSSIISRKAVQPKWICCQNLVVSSVTEREMTKTIIPLSQELFEMLKMIEVKKSIKIAENCNARVIEFDAVPTALIQFYRRKNRIDKFKQIFKDNKIYLETEEELEKVLYFYLTEGKDSQEDRDRIARINNDIEEYAKSMIKKRHALVKISDRTKFQLDENAQIRDILNNTQYLGILIKSSTKESVEAVEAVKKKLKLKESEINLEFNKEADIMFVYLIDKNIAKTFYNNLYEILNKKDPPIKCYELKGGHEDFGGKFKKWKFILNWYDGVPSADVTLRFYDKDRRENLTEVLKNINEKNTEVDNEGNKIIKFNFEVEEPEQKKGLNELANGPDEDNPYLSDNEDADKITAAFDAKYVLKLKNVIGIEFADLLEMEEFLEKKASVKESLDYIIYCERKSNRIRNQARMEDEAHFQKLINYFVNGTTPFDEDIQKLQGELYSKDLYGEEFMEEDDQGYQGGDSEDDYDIGVEGNYNRTYQEDRGEKRWNNDKEKRKGKKQSNKNRGGAFNQRRNKRQDKPLTAEEREARKPENMKKKVTSLKKQREELIKKFDELALGLKEIEFIKDLGLEKAVASRLDIAERIRLEAAFPELENFYVMCFKPDKNIIRRAYIYQRKDNEQEYIEAMKTFLKNHNRIQNVNLGSKIKVSFKGKFVIKINRQIYQNFSQTIKSKLEESKIQFFTKEMTQKIELSIKGKLDNPRLTHEAYDTIIQMLKAETFQYSDDQPRDHFNFYAIFNKNSDSIIQSINLKYSGNVLIEADRKFRTITLRGCDREKAEITTQLRTM